MNLPVVQAEFHELLIIGFHAKCWLASMAFGENLAEAVCSCHSVTQRYAPSASSLLGPDLPVHDYVEGNKIYTVLQCLQGGTTTITKLTLV